MAVKIQKWGNSLGVRISKAVAEKTGLTENSAVELGIEGGNIIIFPSKKTYSLEKLVAQISKGNLHETLLEKREGNEVW